jgi:hypothetical protein
MWPNSRLSALWRIATLLQETNALLREVIQHQSGARSTTPPAARKGVGSPKPAGPESLTYPEERALQEQVRRVNAERAALGLPPI